MIGGNLEGIDFNEIEKKKNEKNLVWLKAEIKRLRKLKNKLEKNKDEN